MAVAALLVGQDGFFLGTTIDSLIVEKAKGPVTKVAVGVGQDGAGCIPDISLWDTNGERIGQRYNKPKYHPRKARNQPEVFGDQKGRRFVEIEIEHTQTTPRGREILRPNLSCHMLLEVNRFASPTSVEYLISQKRGPSYQKWYEGLYILISRNSTTSRSEEATMIGFGLETTPKCAAILGFQEDAKWEVTTTALLVPGWEALQSGPSLFSIVSAKIRRIHPRRRNGSAPSVFISMTSTSMKRESYSSRNTQRRFATACHEWDSGLIKEGTT